MAVVLGVKTDLAARSDSRADGTPALLQGLHMMIIVCSFLFPIALQGAKFCARDGGRDAGVILLANSYAVLLKLAIFDASPYEHANAGDAVRLHAIRRSRPTSLAFITTFPASILGIAMAGVAFLNALAPSPDPAAVRWMACGGSALCWGTLTLHKALHSPVERRVHYSKVRRWPGSPSSLPCVHQPVSALWTWSAIHYTRGAHALAFSAPGV